MLPMGESIVGETHGVGDVVGEVQEGEATLSALKSVTSSWLRSLVNLSVCT